MSIRTLAIATAAAAGLAFSAPAVAAQFVVGIGSVTAVPANNDFQGNLAGIGLVDYTDVGSTVSLSKAATLKFEFIAREAGFNNVFKTTTIHFQSVAPPTTVPWSADQLIGVQSYGAGLIGDWQFLRGTDMAAFGIGTEQFGIFLPAGFARGDTWSSRVLYLGFDDTGAGPDDNHDDLIIRVSIVPEPATWAMLIAGFGLVGFSLRRRKTTEHVTA
ncbi:MAG: PEPxxWA-CTERM sorting domain-containing protein [Thermaurantiacus sp.]